MRWTPGHSSDDVEDRRGERPAMGGMGGVPIGILFWLFSRFGLPGVLIGGVALYFLGGGLNLGGGSGPSNALSPGERTSQDEAAQFVSWAFDDVQSTWQKRFAQSGQQYRRARMVLFTGATQSACGLGQRAMGPFYCPSDQKVYLDLAFYSDLRSRFGKTGDLAQAYVVAHEVGHHVQHLLGADERAGGAARSQGASGGSVRLELQADCYAGVWANSAAGRQLLESGDLEGALEAAASIGDDRLQREATGTVHPEKWTHGSAAERSRWFKRGYELGSMEACDTFGARRP